MAAGGGGGGEGIEVGELPSRVAIQNTILTYI